MPPGLRASPDRCGGGHAHECARKWRGRCARAGGARHGRVVRECGSESRGPAGTPREGARGGARPWPGASRGKARRWRLVRHKTSSRRPAAHQIAQGREAGSGRLRQAPAGNQAGNQAGRQSGCAGNLADLRVAFAPDGLLQRDQRARLWACPRAQASCGGGVGTPSAFGVGSGAVGTPTALWVGSEGLAPAPSPRARREAGGSEPDFETVAVVEVDKIPWGRKEQRGGEDDEGPLQGGVTDGCRTGAAQARRLTILACGPCAQPCRALRSPERRSTHAPPPVRPTPLLLPAAGRPCLRRPCRCSLAASLPALAPLCLLAASHGSAARGGYASRARLGTPTDRSRRSPTCGVDAPRPLPPQVRFHQSCRPSCRPMPRPMPRLACRGRRWQGEWGASTVCVHHRDAPR